MRLAPQGPGVGTPALKSQLSLVQEPLSLPGEREGCRAMQRVALHSSSLHSDGHPAGLPSSQLWTVRTSRCGETVLLPSGRTGWIMTEMQVPDS